MTIHFGPAPGAGLRKSGKVLLFIGIILLLLGVAIGTILSVTGFGSVIDPQKDGTTFTGSTELSLDAGDVVQLYAHTDAVTPTCEVTGPDGSPAGGGTYQSSSINEWSSFDSIGATATGTYTVVCTPDQEVLAAPPVSIGGIFSAVGGILIGIFGGGLGLTLALVGLILLLVGRGQAAKMAAHRV